MAQLYFKYGAMGSSKTANALMARFNYEERGQKTLLCKSQLDTRDGDHMVHSRIGLEYPCVYFHEMRQMDEEELKKNACIIVDEAQFLTKEEVLYLVHLVDDCGIPVLCYGLRADFKGDLFPGSYELLVMADKLEEVKTICWCGKKAAFNARFDAQGHVVKQGAQVVIGANDQYIGLCRKALDAPATSAPTSTVRARATDALRDLSPSLQCGAHGGESGRRLPHARGARCRARDAAPLGRARPQREKRRGLHLLFGLQFGLRVLPERAHQPREFWQGHYAGTSARDHGRPRFAGRALH